MPLLSIIIPTYNEEEYLSECIRSIQRLVHTLKTEVIVVDGGSADQTIERARLAGARIIQSERGRGIQLRAGGQAAQGDFLLFLHADTRMTVRACDAAIDTITRREFDISTFRLEFDMPGLVFSIYSWCSRFDSIGTSFGDQGILIQQGLYKQIGGFPAWQLLEDVELLRCARRVTRVRKLPASVVTSARRFRAKGRVWQQLINASILLRYLAGAEPNELYKRYYADHQANGMVEPPAGIGM